MISYCCGCHHPPCRYSREDVEVLWKFPVCVCTTALIINSSGGWRGPLVFFFAAGGWGGPRMGVRESLLCCKMTTQDCWGMVRVTTHGKQRKHRHLRTFLEWNPDLVKISALILSPWYICRGNNHRQGFRSFLMINWFWKRSPFHVRVFHCFSRAFHL